MRGRSERLSDERLVVRAGRGDETAFGVLYSRNVGDLADFALWVVRDRQVAADVVARTFARVWDRLQTGVRVDGVRAWLYTIARDEALPVGSSSDNASVQLDPLAVVDASRFVNAQAVLEDKELVWLVCASAETLSAKDYSLLDLHLRRNLSAKELATALSLDRAAIAIRLSRLQAALEAPVTASMLARRGRENCGELDAMLQAKEDAPPGDVRSAIRHHARGCQVCQECIRHFAAPAEVFATLTTVPPSEHFSATVWDRVSLHIATAREAASPKDTGSGLPLAAAWRGRRARAVLAGSAAALVGVAAVVTAIAAVNEGDSSSSRGATGASTIASLSPKAAFVPPVQLVPPVSGSRAGEQTRDTAPQALATPGEGRTFAWAPVRSAVAYRLSLFQDDTVVFTARTRDQSLTLPPTWRYDGRGYRLKPGTYHWYVWPIMSGANAPSRKANVSARLVIE